MIRDQAQIGAKAPNSAKSQIGGLQLKSIYASGMTLLIKPASGLCNLRCPYCFYCAETKLRQTESYGFMSEKTLRRAIDYALETKAPELTIVFQGGEPLLRGLAFFELATRYAREQAQGRQVNFSIQTNGTLITEAFAEFFARENYLVGVSLDGAKRIQDLYRYDSHGEGSFRQVFEGIERLKHAGAAFNILTVVHREVAQHIKRIYPFFTRHAFLHQQYIPCLDPFGEAGQYPWSLTEAIYGDFLCELYDLWWADLRAGRYVSIQYFDQLILMLRGQRPQLCGMEGCCTCQNVIEADGSIYPCDFYCLDDYRLGHVDQSPLEIETKRRALHFLEQSLDRPEICQSCAWFALCRSGCRRQRDTAGRGDALGENRFCKAYQRFFAHAILGLEWAAKHL